MNKYIVYVLEIHQMQMEIDAIDKADALDKVMIGDGHWVDNSMEFVDVCDPDTWIVELQEKGEENEAVE